MSEDTSPSSKSWLERFSHILLREPHDRTQLIELLHDAQKRQLLDHDALSMIEGVLRVSEMKVRDIMIPRAQMVTIQYDMTIDDTLPIIIRSTHSRFPITGEDPDAITGILLAKDLLTDRLRSEDNQHITPFIRPAVFVPESKRLDMLLKEFRIKRYHMAVVVDEYGAPAGLITIEDVLEQIVGDIEDEYDTETRPPQHIQQISSHHFMIHALTPLEDFNEYFHTSWASDNCDTVGGYVMQQFGFLPQVDNEVQIDTFLFKVQDASHRRLHMLELTILPSNTESL